MSLFDLFKPPRPPVVRRSGEPYLLEVAGLTVRIQRKPMRTLRLVLLPPDGAVRVSAPLRISDRAIRNFVEARAVWIAAQRLRMAGEAPPPEPRYLDGDTLSLLGRKVVLRVREGGRVARAVLEGTDTLMLKIPQGASRARRESAVWRWYGRELLDAAQALLASRQEAMGVEAGGLKVRAMRSRWGSCNLRTRILTLALELARQPPESLEYVLVHELAHLSVRSHGKRFKSILDFQLPDWRLRRKALNGKLQPPAPEFIPINADGP